LDFFEATRRESSDGMRRRRRDASKRKKVADLNLFYFANVSKRKILGKPRERNIPLALMGA